MYPTRGKIKEAFIYPDDIADVAALTDERHDQKVYEVTILACVQFMHNQITFTVNSYESLFPTPYAKTKNSYS